MSDVLFEHAKRGGVTVRATIADYKGSRFLDIREWVDRNGEPLATRKGVTMPLERARELGEALAALPGPQHAGDAPARS